MKKTILPLLMILAFLAMGLQRNRYEPENRLAYYAVDTASDDTYLVQISGIDSYYAGLFVLIDPNNDNTGACTLNINGLGAKSLKTVLAADPGNNHIDASQIVPLCYDGTNFVIMTPDSNP